MTARVVSAVRRVREGGREESALWPRWRSVRAVSDASGVRDVAELSMLCDKSSVSSVVSVGRIVGSDGRDNEERISVLPVWG